MLKRLGIAAYFAFLLLLGITLGNAFVSPPARAKPIAACQPRSGYLVIINESPYLDFYSQVNCSRMNGFACQWYIVYDLYQEAPNGQFNWIDRQYLIHTDGYCNQSNSADDLELLHAGNFYVDASLYDYTGNWLADAEKYIEIP